MSRRGLVAGVALVALFVAGLVALLAAGGGSGSGSARGPGSLGLEDPGSDVVVAPGDNPPHRPQRAELVAAEVVGRGDDLEFRARLGSPVPRRMSGESFDLLWDLYEDGERTWTLSVALDVGRTVTLLAVNSNFATSSLDEDFPGSVEVAGDVVTITVRPGDFDPRGPRIPDEFSWRLRSRLDGVQGDPRSAVAEDSLPDRGFGDISG